MKLQWRCGPEAKPCPVTHLQRYRRLKVPLMRRSTISQATKEKEESTAVAHKTGSTVGKMKGKLDSSLRIMGLEPSPELIAIAMVYFVQGILGLSRLALSFYFKDELHVEPAEVAILMGLSGIPWVIKPLYGFISDSVPLFGYRRRSYLVLCGLLGTVAWLTLATGVSSKASAVAMMVLASLSTAASDVVVDSIVVERARGEAQAAAGSLQSLCWASASVGGVLSAYFSGSLVGDYGTHFVFGVTALFPLIVSTSALLIDEKPISAQPATSLPSSHGDAAASSSAASVGADNDGDLKKAEDLALLPRAVAQQVPQLLDRVKTLWGAVTRKDILLPTAFVFLWQATPSADTAMFFFQTNQLGFQPEFLGRVRLVGALASLAGVALYNGALKRVPIRTVLWWSMLLGVALGSTQLILISGANQQLGLSNEMFVLGDSVILTVLGQASFMPILVLAARLCPEGVEATLFATLMSILNGGSFVGSALGAWLTNALGVTSDDFTNLFTLVLLCNFGMLLPAPFLSLLPPDIDKPGEDDDSSGDGGQKQAARGPDAGNDGQEGLAQGPNGLSWQQAGGMDDKEQKLLASRGVAGSDMNLESIGQRRAGHQKPS